MIQNTELMLPILAENPCIKKITDCASNKAQRWETETRQLHQLGAQGEETEEDHGLLRSWLP